MKEKNKQIFKLMILILILILIGIINLKKRIVINYQLNLKKNYKI